MRHALVEIGERIEIFLSCYHWFCRYRERRWDLRQLLGSGGMPSSHSSTVTLAVEIGLQEGFGGSHFAITLILASVESCLPPLSCGGHLLCYFLVVYLCVSGLCLCGR